MNIDVPPPAGEFEVLTGPGPAAIAVVRVRGPGTAAFVARHVRMRRGPTGTAWQVGLVSRAELLDEDGAPLDDILISVHATPPEWDLRLHLHANPWLVRHCTDLLRACGLSAMTEAETTLWPTTDALEAEAWALLPRMLTLRGAHWLLTQADRLRAEVGSLLKHESLDFVAQACAALAARAEVVDWFARPLRVVLAGPPNVGKSTLANALADRAMSVVSATPGTTRDWVEVPAEAAGFPVVWLDTAGLRAGTDELERAGIERTRQLLQQADAIVLVLDLSADPGSVPARFLADYTKRKPACVALNKSDRSGSADAWRAALPARWQPRAVVTSAVRRTGLDALCEITLTSLGRTAAALDAPAAFTARQTRLLQDVSAQRDPSEQRHKLLQLLGNAGVTYVPHHPPVANGPA